jgi:hypothetical protein
MHIIYVYKFRQQVTLMKTSDYPANCLASSADLFSVIVASSSNPDEATTHVSTIFFCFQLSINISWVNELSTMTSKSFIATILAFFAVVLLATGTSAFAPKAAVAPAFTRTPTQVHMAIFDGEKERDALTRDTEPEEFFST